jgi:hypothetical protein
MQSADNALARNLSIKLAARQLLVHAVTISPPRPGAQP